MAVRPSGSSTDFFPLYVTADEVEEYEDTPGFYEATSYADYSELYNYLREIVIAKGEKNPFIETYYSLSNPEDYGIDIYIDHYGNGTFYKTLEILVDTDYDSVELYHCEDDPNGNSAYMSRDRIVWDFSNY